MNKLNASAQFTIATLFTLLLGDFYSGFITGPIQLSLYLTSYLISFYFLEKNIVKNDFYFSTKKNTTGQENKLFFSGLEISSEIEQEAEEERYSRVVDPKKMINKKILITSLFLLFSFFLIRNTPQDFRLATLLPFLSASLILLSATVGHLLIPLFLNAFYFTFFSKDLNFITVTIYIGSFLWSLNTYKLLDEPGKKLAFDDSNILKKNLISSILPLLLCILVVSKFILPKNLNQGFNEINKLNHIPNNFNQKKFSLNSMKLNSSNGQKNDLDMIQDIQKALNEQNPNSNHTSSEFNLNQDKIERNISETNTDIGKIQSILNDNKSNKTLSNTDFEKMQKSLEVISKDIRDNDDIINKLSHNKSNFQNNSKDLLDDVRKLSKELKDLEQSTDDRPQSLTELNKKITEISNQINFSNQNKLESIKSSEKTKELIESQKSLKKLTNNGNLSPTEEKNLIKNLESLSKSNPTIDKLIKEKSQSKPIIDELWLAQIVKIFNQILPIIAIFIIIIVLSNLFKKTPLDELKQYNPENELRTHLEEDIKKLKIEKYSVRDEIILTYNLIYKLMKLQYYPDIEAPPPTELYYQVAPKHIAIESKLKTMTDIFCKIFYGNHTATEEDLKIFKKYLPQIFKDFGVKY